MEAGCKISCLNIAAVGSPKCSALPVYLKQNSGEMVGSTGVEGKGGGDSVIRFLSLSTWLLS